MTTGTSKLTSLADLVRDHIHDGETIYVAWFGQNIPFAIGFEILRQKRSKLILCRTGADILFDMLIAAGAVQRVIVGWIGNPGLGLSHSFRRALARRELEVEESSNFTVLLRLLAGSLGIPFLPTKTLLAGDVAEHLTTARPIDCPFSGQHLMAVAALNPDVAIVHAQRADAAGNIQAWGVLGDSLPEIMASRRIVATVEEIVPSTLIQAEPEKTIVPAWRVAAVAHVPVGAHPSYCTGYYDRDDDFYRAYDDLSRDQSKLTDWLNEHVFGSDDWGGHMRRIGQSRLSELIAAMDAQHGQSWSGCRDYFG
jgi:glutaconate CoA-transferase subunit A